MFSYIIFGVLFVVALWCAWHISVADWRRRIIPDPYLFPLIFIGFLVVTCVPWVCGPRDAAIGAAFGYLLSVIVGFVFDWVRRRRSVRSKDVTVVSDKSFGFSCIRDP